MASSAATAMPAATRQAAEAAAHVAAEATSAATAVSAAAASQAADGRICVAPLHAGILVASVVILLVLGAVLLCCTAGTLPLGAIGGHLWGRHVARRAPQALADEGPTVADHTLGLAERIIYLGCPPEALAAATIEFDSNSAAVRAWLEAYRVAAAGPCPTAPQQPRTPSHRCGPRHPNAGHGEPRGVAA